MSSVLKMIVMKIVWFLLGISAFLAFAGLLTHLAIWPATSSPTLAPVAASYVSALRESQIETPVGAEVDKESDMLDETSTSKGSGETKPLPSSSTVVGTVLFDYADDEPR